MKAIKQFLAVIAVLFAAAFLGKVAERKIYDFFSETRESEELEKVLLEASKDINKQLPKYIDKETRMDMTIAGPGKQLVYLYTLVNLFSDYVTEQDLKDEMEENVITGACANDQMAAWLKDGLRLIYRYRGNDERVIGDIEVTRSSCSIFDAKQKLAAGYEMLDTHCRSGSCVHDNAESICKIVNALDDELDGQISGQPYMDDEVLQISANDLRHMKMIFAQCKASSFVMDKSGSSIRRYLGL